MKNVQIQDDVHRDLRVFAAKQGVTLSEAVGYLLNLWENIENQLIENGQSTQIDN